MLNFLAWVFSAREGAGECVFEVSLKTLVGGFGCPKGRVSVSHSPTFAQCIHRSQHTAIRGENSLLVYKPVLIIGLQRLFYKF